MEFWGIEVKPGETVKCEPGDDKYLHLSQASLGEVKKEKGNENIPIYLKVDDQNLMIGTLSSDKCPQITYDLVFEKEFELSHGWKNGSVFFLGYKTEILDEGPDDFSEDIDSESEEEEIPTLVPSNGKPTFKDELVKTKANAVKTDHLAAKTSAKTENSGEDDLSEEDESDDEFMMDGEDDDSDEDDDDEDESSDEDDEPSPKKAEIGKKRAAEPALKTPASNKKAKLPTPHPAANDKSKQQTPKSAGSVTCKSCSKTFKVDSALEAHTKAKNMQMLGFCRAGFERNST